MSDRIEDLSRDLRALCGGALKEADGTERELIFPADSYANICEVRTKLELAIVDQEGSIEDIARCRDELEVVKRLQTEMERRILNHFDTPRPTFKCGDKGIQIFQVDLGAKKKLKKAINDAKASRYDRRKKSKTLQAVMKAIAFSRENGRMPSHDELKKLGFNDQQATDAGKWLDMKGDPNPDADSLFRPLDKPARGRPPKK